jgi:predicted nuclease with TOPRIM domain
VTDEQFVQLFDGLRAEFRELRGEFTDLRGEFAELRGEFTGLDGKFTGLRGEFADLHRHFDVTAEDLRHEIRLVAEGTQFFKEHLLREIQELREELGPPYNS